MSSDIKQELEKALGVERKPEGEIQKIFDRYKRHLSGKIINTPLPEEVHLLDENFPYWIKLQWLNPKNGKWQDVSAAKVLPILEAGQFEDSGYRLEDPRRARALPHLENLLRDPDCIFENHRNGRNGNGPNGIRGKHVYVQKHKGQIKVAFTIYDARLKKVVVVSSFKVSQGWLDRCTGKRPPIYSKAKAALSSGF